MSYLYRVTVKHDSGRFGMTVMAESGAEARQKVMDAEGCPERAIVRCHCVRSVWTEEGRNNG